MTRTLTSLCPACGAQVRFTSESTVIAVCEYCSSTLLRQGDAVANLGRMAELFEDHSPLQLGVKGQLEGVGFTVVGRLQYRHERGAWNEWWARLDDARSFWLSDDNGHYVLTRPVGDQQAPPFESLKPGQAVRVMGVDYTVASVSRARVVAGRGELPFIVGAGYDARVADLRSPGGGFATLDYSDFPTEANVNGSAAGLTGTTAAREPAGPASSLPPPGSLPGESAAASVQAAPLQAAPLQATPQRATPQRATFYVGRPVSLADLKAEGLRTTLERVVATEPFACPACGAAVQASLESTKSISCPACASVIDLSRGVGARLEFVRQTGRVKPTLAIGRTGRLEGKDWTVVGFQRCTGRVDDESFEWNEYLLHAPIEGFRFLVQDRGHWSVVTVSQRVPQLATTNWGRPKARLGGQDYQHFAEYESTVDYVEGEFYWAVRSGDRTRHDDYIAPPRGLSREATGDEVTWSEARYLTRAELLAAFPLKHPDVPLGVGALQPLGHQESPLPYLLLCLASLLVLGVLSAVFALAGSERVIVRDQPLVTGEQAGGEQLVDIGGWRSALLIVSSETRTPAAGYRLDVQVRDRAPASAPGEGRAVEFGGAVDVDADEAGTVGLKLPPGKYLVRVRGAGEPASLEAAGATYAMRVSTRIGSHPFWTGFLLLVVLNGVGVYATGKTEATRWADSVYGSPPPRFRASGSP